MALALAAVACRDTGTETVRAASPGPAFARTSAVLAAIGPGWRTDAAEPYACLATAKAQSGAIPYLYRRVPLHLPPGLDASDGAVTALRYRAESPDGLVLAVLNCVIPATSRAREAVARRFGIPLTPETGGVIVDQVQGCVGDQLEKKTNDCPIAPIVAIGQPVDNPCEYSDYCVPGADPGGGGSGGGEEPADPGTSGGGGACTNCGPNAPTLSCGPELSRGAPVTCSVSNSGDLDIAGWTFSSGNTVISAPGGRTEWSGPAIMSGMVVASLMNGTGLFATLTVKNRGWTWANNGVSEYSDGTGTPCLNHTPTARVSGSTLPITATANGLNVEIGSIDCTQPKRQIQPDSYNLIDGFTVTTAPTGPNAGIHYVSAAALYLRRESTYNLGLFPSAPQVTISNTYVQLAPACGAQTNWYRFSTCMGANPDGFINGVKAHEGRGSTGHNGHYSAAYDAISDPVNDPMRLLDERVGDRSQSEADFRENVRTAFQRAALAADDATRDIQFGGTVVTGNYSGPYYVWFDDHFGFSPNETI